MQQFKLPSLVMLTSLLPIITACVISYSLIASGTELIYLLVLVIPVAYLSALTLFGLGWLWADKIHRRSGKKIPKLTSKLAQLMAAILISPVVILPVFAYFYAK